MSAVDLGLVACAAAITVAFVGLLAVVNLVHWRRGREGMRRYRAACRALSLHRTPEYWAGESEGTWVGTSSVQYRVRAEADDVSLFTRYVARIDPALGLDLHVFREAVISTADGRTARIDSWRRRSPPPRADLVPDPYDGALHVHAADAPATNARLSSPEVVAAVHAALAAGDDLLITDTQVELLAAPWESSPADLGRRLRIVAALARSLARS